MADEECKLTINVIPKNAEKYMAFYIGKHLAFIDSFAFMNFSLDKLSGNLRDEDFIYTSEYFEVENQLSLMKKKGVYPYDYMDSFIVSLMILNYQREKIFIAY